MLELRLQDQHLFMKIFDEAPIGMCLVSPEGKLLRVNQSICSIFGYEKDELTGLTLHALSYPDDLEKNIELRRKAMAGEIDHYRMEKRYIHKTGKVIWGLLSVTVERDDQGKIGFFISQLIDITAQKTKEEELKQTQELHQLISEHSLDIIFRMTFRGIVTYVSPVVSQQLGYTPEEIIGENGYDYWHPTDYQKWPNQNFHQVRTIIHRLRHKNGYYIWFETSSKKIYNDAGKIQHIVGISRNITERRIMELKLQEREQHYKSLLKYTPVGICSVDTELNFTDINPAFELLTGYSLQELLSMNFTDLILPDYLHHMQEQLNQSLKSDYYFEGTPILHKDGSIRIIIAWSSPIIINNETVGIYLIAKDITEQKQTEDLLKNSEKLSVVGELAAGIAHEIRNPLTSLKGFIQLHQMEDPENKNKIRHEVMLSEIERINGIVSELLVLSKPANENSYLANVSKELDHVITLFEGQAHLYNITIHKDIDASLPLIHCLGTLKQVFINVLKNAIESMPGGGDIIVQVKQQAAQISIRFIDEGFGIPPEQLPKIGNPFFTTKEKGTGLGLMVSQRIVQNHRGTMHINSETGKGTIVEINLPIE